MVSQTYSSRVSECALTYACICFKYYNQLNKIIGLYRIKQDSIPFLIFSIAICIIIHAFFIEGKSNDFVQWPAKEAYLYLLGFRWKGLIDFLGAIQSDPTLFCS